MFNLKSAVLQIHPGYQAVFDEIEANDSYLFQQSFSRLLHNIVRDQDAYVVLVDAAARHPNMPGSMGLRGLTDTFLPDKSM